MRNENVNIVYIKEAIINDKHFREKDKIIYTVNGEPYVGIIENIIVDEGVLCMRQLSPEVKTTVVSIYDFEEAYKCDGMLPYGQLDGPWFPDDEENYN